MAEDLGGAAKGTSFWKTLPGILTAISGLIGAVSGLLLAFHQIGVFKGGAIEGPTPAAMIEVPRVVNMRQKDAEKILVGRKLQVGKITQSSTAKVKPGIVVDQHPPAEKEVERNTPVDLWVEEQALPAARVAVPAVTKMDVKDADAILSKHGLRVGAIDREPSKAKPGWVLDQKPGAGIMVERNTEVSLLVAVQPSPPATVTVPRVTKMDVKDAEAELGKHGLRVGMVARQPTSKAKPGWVLHQNQAAGTSVERNATVNLLFAVDASRPSVRVPPIPKVSQKEAEGILAKHELRAGKITTRSGTGMKPGTVVGQWPWPETSIERNSAVELLVAK